MLVHFNVEKNGPACLSSLPLNTHRLPLLAIVFDLNTIQSFYRTALYKHISSALLVIFTNEYSLDYLCLPLDFISIQFNHFLGLRCINTFQDVHCWSSFLLDKIQLNDKQRQSNEYLNSVQSK